MKIWPSQFKQLLKPQKNFWSGFNGIQTHSLCVRAAVLYQLRWDQFVDRQNGLIVRSICFCCYILTPFAFRCSFLTTLDASYELNREPELQLFKNDYEEIKGDCTEKQQGDLPSNNMAQPTELPTYNKDDEMQQMEQPGKGQCKNIIPGHLCPDVSFFLTRRLIPG